MLYTIYKTTNTVNGKFYLGKHQTDNPNDGYLGSGRLLKAAIRKYGRDKFVKEVLFVFGSEAEMNQKEIELVTEAVVNDPQSYNVGIGGEGGPHFEGRKHTEEVKQRLREVSTERGKNISVETRQKIRDNNWAKRDPDAQRQHAKEAGAKATKNPEKTSATMKAYYASNPSKVKGIKRETVVCPHCGKEGAANTMSRWHFDNCKKVVDQH